MIVHTTRRTLRFLGVAFLTLMALATQSQAEMYGFFPITASSTLRADVADQLVLEVTGVGPEVRFTFTNEGPIESFIGQTYFDDAAGVLNLMSAPINGPGVEFIIPGGGSANLPGGNGAPYHFTTDFKAGADELGLDKDGVDIHENVTIPFSLKSGKSLSDVIAALNAGATDPTDGTGTLRIGIHVQSLGGAGGLSDAYLLTPPPAVPVPGAVILGLLGMSLAGWRLRRFA